MMIPELTIESDNALSYQTGEGRRLNYYLGWHRLNLSAISLKIVKSVPQYTSLSNLKISMFKPEGGGADESASSKTLSDVAIKQLHLHEEKTTNCIEIQAKIKHDTMSVVWLRSEDQEQTVKEYDTIIVRIRETSEDKPGNLCLLYEDLYEAEGLQADALVSKQRFAEILALVNWTNRPDQLEISANVLLYLDEVHAALASPGMPSDYVLAITDHGTVGINLFSLNAVNAPYALLDKEKNTPSENLGGQVEEKSKKSSDLLTKLIIAALFVFTFVSLYITALRYNIF